MTREKFQLSLYWKCQLIGWSTASLYWLLMGIIGTNFSVPLAILHFFGDLLIYILPSHLYRNLSLKYHWETFRPKKLLVIVLPMIIVFGMIFMMLTILKNYLIAFYFYPDFGVRFTDFVNGAWLVTWATGIRLMAIWILAYYLYHFAQAEIKANKESARLTLIAKNAQLENLSAQLNPHFFFNSLNNIKALVNENPSRARRAIDLLSELLRTSLHHRNQLITITDEMALVNDYLELEKMRFEERLKTRIEIEENLGRYLIPPLSIQTLVENGIKHGIARLEKGGSIEIHISRVLNRLKIEVKNPGKLERKENRGLGINNLRERLQLHYDGKASFHIEEQNDTISSHLIIPIT